MVIMSHNQTFILTLTVADNDEEEEEEDEVVVDDDAQVDDINVDIYPR